MCTPRQKPDSARLSRACPLRRIQHQGSKTTYHWLERPTTLSSVSSTGMSSDLFIHSCIKSGLYDYYEWAQSGLTGIPVSYLSYQPPKRHPSIQYGFSTRRPCFNRMECLTILFVAPCAAHLCLTPTRLRNRLQPPLTRKPPDTDAIQSNGEANLWTTLHYFFLSPIVALLLRKKQILLLVIIFVIRIWILILRHPQDRDIIYDIHD